MIPSLAFRASGPIIHYIILFAERARVSAQRGAKTNFGGLLRPQERNFFSGCKIARLISRARRVVNSLGKCNFEIVIKDYCCLAND